jgi:hypothetical protein
MVNGKDVFARRSLVPPVLQQLDKHIAASYGVIDPENHQRDERDPHDHFHCFLL